MLNTLVATAAFVLVIGAVAPTSAGAASITFNTSDSQFDAGVDNQGWWSATRSASDSNANYAVGDDVNGDVLRNFFTAPPFLERSSPRCRADLYPSTSLGVRRASAT
jgi:hypothetical protein